MDNIVDLFGARLRALRRGCKLSQEVLAAKAGCDISTLGRTERGEVAPTIRMVAQLADALDISVADMFDFSGRSSGEVVDLIKEKVSTLTREADTPTLKLFSTLVSDFVHHSRSLRLANDRIVV
jgi:transcriptional regulator with XRE-family HTH domain